MICRRAKSLVQSERLKAGFEGPFCGRKKEGEGEGKSEKETKERD